MKKTLAVILSMIMLLCCIPVMSNAAQVDITESRDFSSSNEFESGNTYVVREGATLTVPSNMTAYVPVNSTLRIAQGAKLVVLGKLVVQGALDIEGSLNQNGASKITVEPEATATCDVRFPALADQGLTNRIAVSYASSVTGNAYDDQTGELVFQEVRAQGTTVKAPLNQFLYVKVEILEPDKNYDMYDNSLMGVFFNNIRVPYTQGTCHTLLTDSIDISYSSWAKDSDFYNTFNIYLPTGEGYTVYGREGEQSALGETVALKYGQPFAFRVEIDPEYDMSAYEVYIYNGYGWTNLDTSTLLAGIEPAQPDADGYYYIDAVKGEHTIYVVGVVKNETLLMVGDILDLVRNIFEMISEFFGELLAMLGLGGTVA